MKEPGSVSGEFKITLKADDLLIYVRTSEDSSGIAKRKSQQTHSWLLTHSSDISKIGNM